MGRNFGRKSMHFPKKSEKNNVNEAAQEQTLHDPKTIITEDE